MDFQVEFPGDYMDFNQFANPINLGYPFRELMGVVAYVEP
jgi:hypothetical protein